jgi:hypothetical protein
MEPQLVGQYCSYPKKNFTRRLRIRHSPIQIRTIGVKYGQHPADQTVLGRPKTPNAPKLNECLVALR